MKAVNTAFEGAVLHPDGLGDGQVPGLTGRQPCQGADLQTLERITLVYLKKRTIPQIQAQVLPGAVRGRRHLALRIKGQQESGREQAGFTPGQKPVRTFLGWGVLGQVMGGSRQKPFQADQGGIQILVEKGDRAL